MASRFPVPDLLVAAGLLAAPSIPDPAVFAARCATPPTPAGPARVERIGGWPGGIATRHAPGRVARLAAGIAASWAWDLADLPRRRARLPEPIGGFTPGAAFQAGLLSKEATARPGGAIASLITRWDDLYPPYAIERRDAPERPDASAYRPESRTR